MTDTQGIEWKKKLFSILGGEKYDLTPEEFVDGTDPKALDRMIGFKNIYGQIESLISKALSQSRKEGAEEERERIEKIVESDELIDSQEHWLTKSLETVEYGMAMDALRDYQRNLLDALKASSSEGRK